MREFKFTDTDRQLIKELLTNIPSKIWHDYYRYVFDYGEYSIQLICEIGQAASQNNSDEAIYARIEKVNKKFDSLKQADLIGENLRIGKIYIARTKLYFTDHEDFTKNKIKARKHFNKLKQILTGKKDVIDDLISGTTGGHEEINCHPDYKTPKSIDQNCINILDSGLLIEINGKYLRAYVQGNGYGFPDYEAKYFYTAEELKEDAQYYEFEKIK